MGKIRRGSTEFAIPMPYDTRRALKRKNVPVMRNIHFSLGGLIDEQRKGWSKPYQI